MKILVFGGDRRQIFAARKLCEYNHDVTLAAFENYDGTLPAVIKTVGYSSSEGYDAVVFGVPTFIDGCFVNCPYSDEKYSVYDVLKENEKALVFACAVSAFQKETLLSSACKYFDYGEDRRLKIKNALSTAEGAIALFINTSDITVFGSKCLVSGWGECSRAISKRLKALGADVTVAARKKEALCEARSEGMKTSLINEIPYDNYDAVFNTVPSVIFDEYDVLRFNNALYFEIASFPGGLTDKAVSHLGKRYIKAPSLPGRCAPETSGVYIAETVNEILCERIKI